MVMEFDFAKDQFAHLLHRALSSLYDPALLQSNLLVNLLDIGAQDDPAIALRQILVGAIESLKPSEPTPAGSRSWRIYQVLRRRYLEQGTQHEVAANLGLSIRQLQREEKIAREVIAERLWVAHNVGAKKYLLIDTIHHLDQEQVLDSIAPSAAQELETLSQSTSDQVIQLSEMLQEVLDTLQLIPSAPHITTQYQENTGLLPIKVKVPMLRQALFNLISVAVRFAAGETLRVEMDHDAEHVYLKLQTQRPLTLSPEEPGEYLETLEMAKQLLAFCQAELNYTVVDSSQPALSSTPQVTNFTAEVIFPVAEVFTILVIDDNADARQLLQRYLYGTPYHFIGAQDSQQALSLVQQMVPNAIILDVMMPKQDGWTFIGQLRNLPKLQSVPIIVSTILPQKDLAFLLGAADFIRKPVKRQALLAALARQLDRQKESKQSL